jgi:hypothetical protein
VVGTSARQIVWPALPPESTTTEARALGRDRVHAVELVSTASPAA